MARYVIGLEPHRVDDRPTSWPRRVGPDHRALPGGRRAASRRAVRAQGRLAAMPALRRHSRRRRRPRPRPGRPRGPASREVSPEAAARPGDVRVVHAPGRVNLIGEHTDYNEGFVLPVAIDLGIAIALVPTDDRRVRADAGGDRRDARVRPRRRRPQAGRLDRLRGRHGVGAGGGGASATRGFRGILASDLPQGAGPVVVRGAGAGVVAGRSRAASCRPLDRMALVRRRPARRERVHRRQLRAHGPVRVGLRRGRPRAPARLPDAGPPRDPDGATRTSRSSPATPARRASSSRPPTTSAGRQCEAAVAEIARDRARA